jgi:hypothetical protein
VKDPEDFKKELNNEYIYPNFCNLPIGFDNQELYYYKNI